MRLARTAARAAGRRLGDATKRRLVADFLSYPLWQLPGHYYSPLPDPESAIHAATRAVRPVDVDLREDRQLALLEQLAPKYGDIDFPAVATPGWRFYHENSQFPYGDAILLNLLLRHWQPQRIVEVGSGYSTAVMIDTIERHFDHPVAVTCIEPFPDRVRDVVGAFPDYVTLLAKPVQDVPAAIVDQLEPGDVLFIDSTHVAKTGSDVVFELFEMLPRIAAGVHVHFHDICWPFEYPVAWARQGRAWNEIYLLHAFLASNEAFEVVLFNHMMVTLQEDWFAAVMPRCLCRRSGVVDDVPAHGMWLTKT